MLSGPDFLDSFGDLLWRQGMRLPFLLRRLSGRLLRFITTVPLYFLHASEPDRFGLLPGSCRDVGVDRCAADLHFS